LLWIALCLVDGLAVAWVASTIERYRAPVFLFSLLVGLAVGVTLAGLLRLAQVGHRPTLLLGAALAALTAVTGQHYIGYRVAHADARDDARAYQMARMALGDQVLGQMPVPPEGFVAFLRWRVARGYKLFGRHVRGAAVWSIWAVDALLVLAGALVVVIAAWRRPYCNRCHSWLAVTRRGEIDGRLARRVGAALDAEPPGDIASARYWLATCRGGCGPTAFELSWKKPGGGASSVKAWLDAERRNRVLRALDGELDAGADSERNG
jgi:hypothetical protein